MHKHSQALQTLRQRLRNRATFVSPSTLGRFRDATSADTAATLSMASCQNNWPESRENLLRMGTIEPKQHYTSDFILPGRLYGPSTYPNGPDEGPCALAGLQPPTPPWKHGCQCSVILWIALLTVNKRPSKPWNGYWLVAKFFHNLMAVGAPHVSHQAARTFLTFCEEEAWAAWSSWQLGLF